LLRAKEYIPPGIDLSIFYPKSHKLDSDWSNRVITIGCIGRKEAWKGTIDVLNAFDILKQKNYNVRLLVAYGNLPETRDLSSDCVVIIPKNDRELADFYRSIDIMIAPGTIQLGACHYPVIEAMACGIPVITTGYLPAIEGKDNAWIVPIKDASAIAKTVKEIAIDPDLRDRRIAKAINDIQDFSWEHVSSRMIEIFENQQ
jgi:glycosyltransferase involved in cell wall biosynthesis